MHKTNSTRKRKTSVSGRTPMESLQMLQQREKGVAAAMGAESRHATAGSGSNQAVTPADLSRVTSMVIPTSDPHPPSPAKKDQQSSTFGKGRPDSKNSGRADGGALGAGGRSHPTPSPGGSLPGPSPTGKRPSNSLPDIHKPFPPPGGGMLVVRQSDGRVSRGKSNATGSPESPLALTPSPNALAIQQQQQHQQQQQAQLAAVGQEGSAGVVALAPKIHDNAGKEPASYTTFASLEGAKIRRQLFTLCQQLFRGSNVHMEIIVKEQGSTVWQSSNWDEDEPIVQVDVLDDDIQEVQRRSRNAFNKTVSVYNKKLKQQQHEIEKLRTEQMSKEQGGSRYAGLQKELEASRFDSRKQMAKIKSLVKLLDRAAGQLKSQEEQRENEQQARLAGETGLDWLGVQAVMKDLVVEDREDHAVLRDVANFVEQTTTRLNEVEINNEILSEKCAEKDSIAEAFKKERDSTALNNMKLSYENIRVTTEGDELRAEVSSLNEEVAKVKAEAEAERNKLHAMLSAQELAMRNAVESKAHFIGLGKSASVNPYMRFEGKVRNLELPKKDIEQMIVHIWATREEVTTKMNKTPSLSAIDRRAEKSLIQHFNATHQRSVELAQLDTMSNSVHVGPTETNSVTTDPSASTKSVGQVDADGATLDALMPAPQEGGITSSTSEQSTGLAGRTEVFLGVMTCCNPFLVDYNNDSLWVSKGAAALVRSQSPSSSSKGGASVASVPGTITPLSLPDHITRFVVEQYCQDRASVLMPPYNAWMNGVTPSNRHAQVDFLLKRATAMPSVAAEVAYSLLDGCERYKYDADVELFRRIIKKEISESAFFDQMMMIQKLKFALIAQSFARDRRRQAEEGTIREDLGTGVQPDPELSPTQLIVTYAEDSSLGVDEVMQMCYSFFPAKPAESFPLLRTALETDVRTNMARKGKFHIPRLFASNEFGNQGAFVEAVRDQHLDEVCMHVAEVADAISGTGARPLSRSTNVAPTGAQMKEGEATLASVRSALMELDPYKPTEDINHFLMQLLELSHQESHPSPTTGSDGGKATVAMPPAEPEAGDLFNLNTVVDCIDLSRLSKQVFCKRCGRPNKRGSTSPKPGQSLGQSQSGRNQMDQSGTRASLTPPQD